MQIWGPFSQFSYHPSSRPQQTSYRIRTYSFGSLRLQKYPAGLSLCVSGFRVQDALSRAFDLDIAVQGFGVLSANE